MLARDASRSGLRWSWMNQKGPRFDSDLPDLVMWVACPKPEPNKLGAVCARNLRTQQRAKSQCQIMHKKTPCSEDAFGVISSSDSFD